MMGCTLCCMRTGMRYTPIHHLILALTFTVYISFGNKLKNRLWARTYHTTSVFDLIDGWTGGNLWSQVSQSCGKPGNQMSRDFGTTWSSLMWFQCSVVNMHLLPSSMKGNSIDILPASTVQQSARTRNVKIKILESWKVTERSQCTQMLALAWRLKEETAS